MIRVVLNTICLFLYRRLINAFIYGLGCFKLGKYISALFTSLTSMLHFELPHVNVLSKLDLMQKYKPTEFNLDFYCEVLDLSYLIQSLSDDPFFARFKQLTSAISDLIEQYGLVSFVPLNIHDPRTVSSTLNMIDKANGFYLIRIKTEQHRLRFYDDYFDLCPAPSSSDFKERGPHTE